MVASDRGSPGLHHQPPRAAFAPSGAPGPASSLYPCAATCRGRKGLARYNVGLSSLQRWLEQVGFDGDDARMAVVVDHMCD